MSHDIHYVAHNIVFTVDPVTKIIDNMIPTVGINNKHNTYDSTNNRRILVYLYGSRSEAPPTYITYKWYLGSGY